MKKSIVFIVILLTILMIPISVNADEDILCVENDQFEYDGSIKYLNLVNTPQDLSPDDICWILKPSGVTEGSINTGASISIGREAVAGEYTVTVGSEGAILTGNYEISQKKITIKPIDISEEFQNQTIIAKDFAILSGSLVDSHHINVVFKGSLNRVGEAVSRISDYIITDNENVDVTRNYNVSLQSGKLILTKPFEVTTDPEQKGQIAGGKTAVPPPEPAGYSTISSSTNSNSSGSGNDIAGDGTQSENTDEIMTDNQIPLSNGSTPIPDSKTPLANEANGVLGIAVFLAIFMILAIIVTYLIARHRNKTDY